VLVRDGARALVLGDISPRVEIAVEGTGVQVRSVSNPNEIRRNVLKPLMAKIGAAGLGFHALRHTYASLQLAAGVNILQLSRALGHHSPAFTLSVYCHLLEGDEAPPLDLAAALELPPALRRRGAA
jgi:integrase